VVKAVLDQPVDLIRQRAGRAPPNRLDDLRPRRPRRIDPRLGSNEPHVWATVGAEARVRANPAVVANDETVVARVQVERVGHPVVAGLVRPADDDVGAVAERFVARVAAPAQTHLFADAYGLPTRVRERL